MGTQLMALLEIRRTSRWFDSGWLVEWSIEYLEVNWGPIVPKGIPVTDGQKIQLWRDQDRQIDRLFSIIAG